jgi:hypothetical protein
MCIREKTLAIRRSLRENYVFRFIHGGANLAHKIIFRTTERSSCLIVSWISSVPPGTFQSNTPTMPRPLPSKSFPILYLLFILLFGAV